MDKQVLLHLCGGSWGQSLVPLCSHLQRVGEPCPLIASADAMQMEFNSPAFYIAAKAVLHLISLITLYCV
eukprot:1158201-Pelagomonas_calceolata.AAC.3